LKSIVDFLLAKYQLIWDRFNQLSKREKQAAIAAVLLVLALLLDNAVLKPIQKNISGLNEKISIEEKKFMHNIRSVDQKPRIDGLYSDLSQNISLSVVSDEQARVSMLEDIEKYARERRIYLTEVKPQVATQQGDHKEYRIRLQMEGTFQDMMSFLADLVRTKKLYLVETLRVTPHPEDVNKIKATAAVNRIVFSK
jgi:hypothetical protein